LRSLGVITMRYASEELMYPEVSAWLERFLLQRHLRSEVRVLDTSHLPVYRALRRLNITGLPGDWESWDIRVDVLGIISSKQSTQLALVECKNCAITLAHLSQLLGYCRVVQPEYAFILSPVGVSDSLKRLVVTHGRRDVLEYQHPARKMARSIVISRWDMATKSLDYASVITGDDNRARV